MKTGWGGPRPGAGRPAGPRPPVHHVKRPPMPRHYPAHVTFRVRRDVPSLRRKPFLRELRQTWRKGCERGDFRLVHYSIQGDHAHLIVEAAGKKALECGMKSIGIRFARAVNRVYRRKGPALEGRYHLRLLETPREVRSALAYVLLNARRHWRKRNGTAPSVRIDEASSGRWFDGWRRGFRVERGREPPEVSKPHTWLLREGWRRHGLVCPSEIPGSG